MLFSLHNKKAAITGAGSGIGLAIAQVFAQQGAEVYILDLNEATAEAAVQSILDQGGKARAYACDVSNQTQVKAIFQEIGALDILVNNAGIAHIGNVENTSEADFDRVMNINVKGVYNCLHAAIPLMKAKGGGVILNMASVAATIGIPDRLAYSTTKGAVLSMTLATAKDYLKHNIRCNCISPARVHTPFVDGFLSKNYPGQEAEMFDKLAKTQPIGRMAKPSEVAYLALYLCSEEAGFITGCDYPLDGGFTRLNN
ncbi:MAG: SDR family oxidoreductase [Haliscomenobacter sp.]|uniref:SDR family NAD(P)-dependent oxidoreductase n=1 Tax=Haliscomenobacter sp. TaxID=2717303 RepID=UPI0029A9707B|nr:SDR family oxidoreductase [Haliscomenobacter sp.]MDX2071923.1 SDR family oxidoreductase [Haliscomenobacter sp.]